MAEAIKCEIKQIGEARITSLIRRKLVRIAHNKRFISRPFSRGRANPEYLEFAAPSELEATER